MHNDTEHVLRLIKGSTKRSANDVTDCDRDAAVTGLVGASEPMRQLRSQVQRLANSPNPLVIYGETGTGKELVARAHHELGRRGKPFIAVNCGTLGTLAEGRLLGHTRGSFTDAHRDAAGFFELAKDGTLFLDEIADLPIEVQPIFLRVLDGYEYTAIGGCSSKVLRARVVAASNVDLEQRVSEKRFRADLLYRLSTHTIRVPSLSERLEDIPDLVAAAMTHSSHGCEFTLDAIALLRARMWPGNVRELNAHARNAAVHAVNGVVDGAVLRSLNSGPKVAKAPTNKSFDEQVNAYAKELLVNALRAAGGNQRQAAKRLKMDASTFRRHARRLAII